MSIGNKLRIREEREKKHIIQEEMAEILGIKSAKTYANYENGLQDIPSDILVKMAGYFDKSIDYLLGISDYTKDGNEYISSVTGLSDKAINQLRKLVQHDTFLKQSNKDNEQRKDNLSVRPVQIVERIPILNFVLGSRSFINLINDFVYYLDSDKYTKMLDGSFHELPTKEIIPADNDLIAGGVMLEIDSDTNKALAKNLLDIQLNKLVQEYKNSSRQQDTKN